jgi:hypothetical protein
MDATTYVILNDEHRSELLNLRQVVSATRSRAVDAKTAQIIPDKYIVTVRTVDGKEQRFGGQAGEILWGILESAALAFRVATEEGAA